MNDKIFNRIKVILAEKNLPNKYLSESLAWETEVWIADMPEHMIHLNGDKFLGPR